MEECPVCKGREGKHSGMAHAIRVDFRHFLPRLRPERRKRPLIRSDAVREAERIVRRGRRR